MKKKTLLLFLSAVLACSMLSGCGGKEEVAAPVVTDISESNEEPEEDIEEEPEEEPEETREGMYRQRRDHPLYGACQGLGQDHAVR